MNVGGDLVLVFPCASVATVFLASPQVKSWCAMSLVASAQVLPLLVQPEMQSLQFSSISCRTNREFQVVIEDDVSVAAIVRSLILGTGPKWMTRRSLFCDPRGELRVMCCDAVRCDAGAFPRWSWKRMRTTSRPANSAMGGIRDRVGDKMRRATFVYLKRFEVGREEKC